MRSILLSGALLAFAATASATTIPLNRDDATPPRWTASLQIDDESTHLTAINGVDTAGVAWHFTARPYDAPQAEWTANSVHLYTLGDHRIIVALDPTGRPVGAWGIRDVNGEKRHVAYQLAVPESESKEPMRYW